MSLLSFLSKPFSKIVAARIDKWSRDPIATQQKVFDELIAGGLNTAFGKDHHFSKIKTYEDFKKNVPIRDYENIKPYIERIKKGEANVLWKGRPIYFSKTSGTTSGIKYIPITKESISNHLNSTRDALLMYIRETGRSKFLDGKLIFISGSPELEEISGIPVGRLSGIVNHHIPRYLRINQLPSYKTNIIEDWETKIEKIVDETIDQDMSLISGIPPWVQMYFDRLTQRSGKKIKDLFPNFNLFIYGGVNFEPYRQKLEQSIGKKVDSIELFPASEGFIAFQDSQYRNDLLLILNSGVFFEFIPASEFFNNHPTRISLKDVQQGINYVMVLSSNAGLWGYLLGDTVKFTSVNPYKIVVTGRITHYISAFGEHVIAEEVEKALFTASAEQHAEVAEFTVAPQVAPPTGGLPYHEWFIEFHQLPCDLGKFSLTIDKSLQEQNIYYRDLITGHILQPLKINALPKGTFINYMKSKGKLGGQNKVPRLSNDRAIADELKKYIVT